jgi:hypothetical protein
MRVATIALDYIVGRSGLGRAIGMFKTIRRYVRRDHQGHQSRARGARARQRVGAHDDDRSEPPLVVVDFPTRGVAEEQNFPREVGDPARKYISSPIPPPEPRAIFKRVKHLQEEIAHVRVFAAPELHQLVLRYLTPEDVLDCVRSQIPAIRGGV